jgi:hypothetical protein
MNKKKYLFIDIRKSDEVYSNRLESSEDYGLYFFPMNTIQFNREEIIEHLKYVDEIYLVCRSASRSQYVKDRYFSEYPRIKVSEALQFSNLNHGLNEVMLNGELLHLNVVGSNSFNLYSIMRIIQLMLGSLILGLGGYTYIKIRKKGVETRPLIVLLLFGLMALINGLTSTCTMSLLLQDYLN